MMTLLSVMGELSTSDVKVCTKCKIEKPESEFTKSMLGRGGLRSQCKSCIKIYDATKRKTYRQTEECKIAKRKIHKKYKLSAAGKEVVENNRLKCTFGITLKDYHTILKDQNNGCAICGTKTPGGQGKFHVDHCHDTGKVRGLLCNRCNPALGLFNDNISLLLKAIQYLIDAHNK